MSSPAEAISQRRNSFDLLRLILAVLVVFEHAEAIGGFSWGWFDRSVKGQSGLGTIAVLGFFGLSGYLISQSFVRTRSWAIFARHRLLRLMPAYYAALLFTAFLAAPAIAHYTHHSWSSGSAWSYVGHNAALQMKQWTIGQELGGLPFTSSINGALWSLFPEACCYGFVLVIGLTGALTRRWAEVGLLTGLLFCLNTVACLPIPLGPTALPSLLALSGTTPYVLAFAVGMMVQAYRDRLALGAGGAVLFGLLSASALKFGGWMIFGPVIFPLFILHLGHAFSCRLKHDLSYGIYVFHFPVLQVLTAAGFAQHDPVIYFLAALAVTGVCAASSWWAIERPALRFK